MNHSKLANSNWNWTAVFLTVLLAAIALFLTACRSGSCCGGTGATPKQMDHDHMDHSHTPGTNSPATK